MDRSEKREAYPQCDDPITFSNVGLELSCMQFAPRASLMLLLVGQPRFNSNRLEIMFLGGNPLPTHTPLVLCIADIYLSQTRVTNSDGDLLSSETVHQLISYYTAR